MRSAPRQISTEGASDGDALLFNPVTDEYEPGPVLVSGVESVVGGTNVDVDNTDPAHPIISTVPLVPLTTSINGVPDLVWDTDDQLVLTESPAT